MYHPNELYHHGIIGQRWGVKNGPPYPLRSPNESRDRAFAKKNLKGARTANLDKWGQDASHNTLYIIGGSGSGKSTTALGIAKKNDSVIHLDGYAEEVPSLRNKKFNDFLDRSAPDWREIPKAQSGNSKVKPFSKEYWILVDQLKDSIEQYSIREFAKGNRVIVEGVQLADGWYTDDKLYFKDQPLIIMKTGMISSMIRAGNRDEISVLDIGHLTKVIEASLATNRNIKEIENLIETKNGKDFVEELFA